MPHTAPENKFGQFNDTDPATLRRIAEDMEWNEDCTDHAIYETATEEIQAAWRGQFDCFADHASMIESLGSIACGFVFDQGLRGWGPGRSWRAVQCQKSSGELIDQYNVVRPEPFDGKTFFSDGKPMLSWEHHGPGGYTKDQAEALVALLRAKNVL